MLKSHSKIQSVRSFMLTKGVPGTITNQSKLSQSGDCMYGCLYFLLVTIN